MLTSKQRAKLRAMAHDMDTIVYVGKAGITDNVAVQVDEALSARELIKGTVQQNAPMSAAEALSEIAEKTGAEPVSAIGRKFVLYRPRPQDPTIQL